MGATNQMSRVLILGAGASHGHGVTGAHKPPLCGGFFNHPISGSLNRRYQELFEHIEDTTGSDVRGKPNVDVEELFGKLESGWKLGGYQSKETILRFGTPEASVCPLDIFCGYLVDMIHLATKWLKKNSCPFHTKIVKGWLKPGDTIISFNYDLIMDCSLKQIGLWHESSGYGLSERQDKTSPKSAIMLLKPHGSLNWFPSYKNPEPHGLLNWLPSYKNPSLFDRSLGEEAEGNKKSEETIRVMKLDETVRGRLDSGERDWSIIGIVPGMIKYVKELASNELDFVGRGLVEFAVKVSEYEKPWFSVPPVTPLLVFPTPYKSLRKMMFAELKYVWRHVRTRLEKCKEIVAIGFSFRDEHFNQLLFESSLERATPLRLRVVTKDLTDVERISGKFGSGNIEVEHIRGWLEEFSTTIG
jgi:hypothetical protein